MDRSIEVRPGGPGAREALPPITAVLLFAGVAGALLLFSSIDGARTALAGPLLLAAVLSASLWASLRRSGRAFCAVFLGASVLCALGAWRCRDVLGTQGTWILRGILGRPREETMEVQATAWALSGGLSLLLFAMEHLIRDHETVYALGTLLLIFSPLLGMEAGWASAVLLGLFLLAYRTIQMTGRRGRRSLLPEAAQTRLAGMAGTAMCGILLLGLAAAVPFALLRPDDLYAPVYAVEEAVTTAVQRVTGTPEATGRISRGGSYHTGAPCMEIRSSLMPTEPLYLRMFSGGDYLGGQWAPDTDEAILRSLADGLPYADLIRDQIGPTFRDMYFLANQNAWEVTEPVSRMLAVRGPGGTAAPFCVPYYSQLLSSGEGGWVWLSYEQRDMDVSWEEIGDGRMRAVFASLEAAYLQQARRTYTRVPTDLLPRLTALSREAGELSDPGEITAFILHALHGRAVYSLTPGWGSFNKDIVEDFLFDRGKGYCQHFASAGTLLYRLLGIPARYAAGYVVEPEGFLPDGSGGYLAVVTDRSAHAWAEIFLEGYGWTPVELTPASEEQAAGPDAYASFPGFDRLRAFQIGRERGWELFQTLPRTGQRDADGDPDASPDVREDDGVPAATPRPPWGILRGTAIALLILGPLIVWRRRRWILSRAEGMDCRAVYWRLCELFRCEDEGEIVPRLAELSPAVTGEEAARVLDLADRAAYGPAPPGAEEDAFARDVYRRAAERVYAGLSPLRRLSFKWIRVLG